MHHRSRFLFLFALCCSRFPVMFRLRFSVLSLDQTRGLFALNMEAKWANEPDRFTDVASCMVGHCISPYLKRILKPGLLKPVLLPTYHNSADPSHPPINAPPHTALPNWPISDRISCLFISCFSDDIISCGNKSDLQQSKFLRSAGFPEWGHTSYGPALIFNWRPKTSQNPHLACSWM